jgi:hypothetical protein
MCWLHLAERLPKNTIIEGYLDAFFATGQGGRRVQSGPLSSTLGGARMVVMGLLWLKSVMNVEKSVSGKQATETCR